MREVRFDSHGSALGKSIDEPVRRRLEAGLIQQWRMEEIGHRTDAGDSVLDDLPRLLKNGRWFPVRVKYRHIHIDLRSRKPLTKTIVQFAGNASAFLVLHAHQPGGKFAQG